MYVAEAFHPDADGFVGMGGSRFNHITQPGVMTKATTPKDSATNHKGAIRWMTQLQY
jgi:hypothetical protein